MLPSHQITKKWRANFVAVKVYYLSKLVEWTEDGNAIKNYNAEEEKEAEISTRKLIK